MSLMDPCQGCFKQGSSMGLPTMDYTFVRQEIAAELETLRTALAEKEAENAELRKGIAHVACVYDGSQRRNTCLVAMKINEAIEERSE